MNPIVSFHLFKYIMKNNILDDEIVAGIKKLTHKLGLEDRVFGAYTPGHLAISTLIVLKNEAIETLYKELSEFDKEMVYHFLKSSDWLSYRG